jgi:hypothetical protein
VKEDCGGQRVVHVAAFAGIFAEQVPGRVLDGREPAPKAEGAI